MALQPENYDLPAHWASYLINNDASGISAEEKAQADRFLKENELPFPVSCGEQSWFSRSHDASHITKCAGDVLNYTFLINKPLYILKATAQKGQSLLVSTDKSGNHPVVSLQMPEQRAKQILAALELVNFLCEISPEDVENMPCVIKAKANAILEMPIEKN